MPLIEQGSPNSNPNLCGVTEFTAFHTSNEGGDSTIGVDLSQHGVNLAATSNAYISQNLSSISDTRFDAREYTHTIKFSVVDPTSVGLQVIMNHTADQSSGITRRLQLRRDGSSWRYDWTPTTSGSNTFLAFHTDPGWQPLGTNEYTASITVMDSMTPGQQTVIFAIHRRSSPESFHTYRFELPERDASRGAAAVLQYGSANNNLQRVTYDQRPLPPGFMRYRYEASSTAPEQTTMVRMKGPVLSIGTGIADAGRFYGPQPLLAARSNNRNATHLFAPLVNERFASNVNRGNASLGDARLLRAAPDSDTYSLGSEADAYRHWLGLAYLRRRPVPRGANRLLCRVHLNAPAPSSGSFVPIKLRVWSSDSMRIDDGARSFVEVEITEPLMNQWVGFPLLRPILDSEGFTYLCISFAVGESGNTNNNQTFRLAAWSVVPRATFITGDFLEEPE